LIIPAGSGKTYSCAQLDDYHLLNRNQFPHTADIYLSLEARVSEKNIPGTWGFGFWNDPFQVNLGVKGAGRRIPSLPNTAWYFYASKENYLAFSNHHPATGMLAATFRSPQLPIWLFAGAIMFLPLLVIPITARIVRKFLSRIIQEDAVLLTHDVTIWNQYVLLWRSNKVDFLINGKQQWSTTVVPQGRLGLVIWIDNQYAAFPPNGRIKMGVLPSTISHWMEVKNIQMA